MKKFILVVALLFLGSVVSNAAPILPSGVSSYRIFQKSGFMSTHKCLCIIRKTADRQGT